MALPDKWQRVSHTDPCPICQNPDNCCVSADGEVVYCGRISEGSIKQNDGGQFLHILRDDGLEPGRHFPRPVKKRKPIPVPVPEQSRQDFAEMAEGFFRSDKPAVQSRIVHQRRLLSSQLGVSVEALHQLMVGWDGKQWTCPERDARGNAIGISTRTLNGQKRFIAGGKRGLIYAPDWDTGDGDLFIVEGLTDTAAIGDLEISVIGRFSNRGGVWLLAEMLANFPREIIVVAERDQKPDGRWPGRDGAIDSATQLAEILERRIGWSFPPGNAKDARSWLNTTHGSRADWLAGLEITWITPPPIFTPDDGDKPILSLRAWRQQISSTRTAILNSPGTYLDRSPTGAGKSHADTQAAKRVERSLIVMPAHSNCLEVLADMEAEGISAKAYPARLTKDQRLACPRCIGEVENFCRLCHGGGFIALNRNCWNLEANAAEDMGLPVVSTICPTCSHSGECKAGGYLGQIREASESPVAIATHARGEYSGLKQLGTGRNYQAIHENALSLLRPTVEITEPDLATARCILEILLTEPRWLDWFGGGETDVEREHRGDLYDFTNHMLTVAQSIADQTRTAVDTMPLDLPESMLKPNGMESILFQVSRANKANFARQSLRLLLAAAAGEIHQLGVVTSARPARTEDRTDKNHRGRVQQSAPSGCHGAVL